MAWRNPESGAQRYLLLLTILVVPFLLHTEAQAAEGAPSRINVVGEGRVSLAPDTAMLTLTVTREAPTAKQALKENSAAMSKVLDAMRDEGIEKRDLQTSGFGIQPRYVYPGNRDGDKPQTPKIVGYTVRNTLSVRVRDIARVGAVLDTSVQLGVNEGGQIELTNDDPSAAIDQAREAAVKDALARARTLASAAGVKIGEILDISESYHHPAPAQKFMARSEMAVAADAAAVPVASGENTYSVRVNIAVAIEQ